MAQVIVSGLRQDDVGAAAAIFVAMVTARQPPGLRD